MSIIMYVYCSDHYFECTYVFWASPPPYLWLLLTFWPPGATRLNLEFRHLDQSIARAKTAILHGHLLGFGQIVLLLEGIEILDQPENLQKTDQNWPKFF